MRTARSLLFILIASVSSGFTSGEFDACWKALQEAQRTIDRDGLKPLRSRSSSVQAKPLSYDRIPEGETQQKEAAYAAFNYVWIHGNKVAKESMLACRRIDGATRIRRSPFLNRARPF